LRSESASYFGICVLKKRNKKKNEIWKFDEFTKANESLECGVSAPFWIDWGI
jgi:hypothetical protein